MGYRLSQCDGGSFWIQLSMGEGAAGERVIPGGIQG